MAKGRKLARQQFTEMVNTTHRNMTNKYGETVTPHSKVCSICHQRVDGLKAAKERVIYIIPYKIGQVSGEIQ